MLYESSLHFFFTYGFDSVFISGSERHSLLKRSPISSAKGFAFAFTSDLLSPTQPS